MIGQAERQQDIAHDFGSVAPDDPARGAVRASHQMRQSLDKADT